ncbi:MAG TPA: hypothetical protein VL961_00485 [Acidimicrobiales bacterium]|nr:hypothetical protein [Acidimicrobiales bacterium]
MLGFFSFTEITAPDGHGAYNEWHQLDHLPQQFSLDGIWFGQRWVCSPPCREARVAVSERLAPSHYVTLYLMRDASVLDPFARLGRDMWAAGRFFEDRRALVSGAFEVGGRWSSPGAVVSADVIPHRPSNGIYLVVGPPIDGAALAEQEGLAGAWSFEPFGAAADLPAHVTVGFVAPDSDPLAVARDVGQWVDDSCHTPHIAGGSELEWAGPLERIDPYRWDWFARLTPQ